MSDFNVKPHLDVCLSRPFLHSLALNLREISILFSFLFQKIHSHGLHHWVYTELSSISIHIFFRKVSVPKSSLKPRSTG